MKKIQFKKEKISFTKEGLDKVKKEYEEVLSTRKEAIKTLARAREMGDLSENGFYKAAKANLFSIYSKLRHLNYLIKSAEIVQSQEEGVSSVGKKVKVSEGNTTRIFHIVGRYEADPLAGKISDESPIGRELIGKKEGDVVKITTPKGEIIYKILEVS